ncbi:hypothetical protein [Halopiger aswanensis]|uniref:Uncharacterized protein n=1 Tax=Halopiger aswanensis TaxID=148449 RepID=A0A3R7HJ65_9EURY|nr:hypothetical protein [Halopiger aswanensis]RKD95730.1 hypothetical protein ATJ93_2592 [Halopiger aswanensis]
MTSSDDGGYVHDPGAFDEDGERREPAGTADTDAAAGERAPDADRDDWVEDPIHPGMVDREFDWRGWTLVGVIVFAFLIAPATIILLPPSNYRFALLILPLAPAVLLALTAVWATVRP